MTLEEAICFEEFQEARFKEFEEKFGNSETRDYTGMSEYSEQLANWLKELKAYKESPVLQRWLKQCDSCKHRHKLASEAPCRSCCHTFKNKHEEVKADEPSKTM